MAGILFVVSMLPNWGLALISSPAGDDYYYSIATHQAWVQTHSVIEVLKAAFETTKKMCIGWNGDWFSVFCFTFMPEAFVRGSYWIFPLFWSFATVGATIYFLHEVLTKYLKFKWYENITVASIVLFLMYQWIPRAPLALYWHVGVLHYIMPHVVCLLMLTFLAKYVRSNDKRYIVFSVLGSIAIGGSSYYSSFLLFFVYILILGWRIITGKKDYAIVFPLFAGIIALYFQLTAPGNAARVGENTMEFSLGRAFEVVVQAVVSSVVKIGEYFINSPFILILLILLAVLVWLYMLEAQTDIEFKYPLLWVVYMYGIYAALFTPELYANTPISSGPATMEYISFLFLTLSSIVYVEGWLMNKLRKGNKLREQQWYRIRVMLPALVFCCVLAVLNKGTVKEMLFWESCEYIVSGQAADFKKQIDSQMEILWDDSIKEAYVCPMNPIQGPLACMPPTTDPESFENKAMRDFFGKDIVVVKEAE